MAPPSYVAEDCLISHRSEGKPLVLWKHNAPAQRNARGVTWKCSLLEAKGREMPWRLGGGENTKGATFEM